MARQGAEDAEERGEVECGKVGFLRIKPDDEIYRSSGSMVPEAIGSHLIWRDALQVLRLRPLSMRAGQHTVRQYCSRLSSSWFERSGQDS